MDALKGYLEGVKTPGKRKLCAEREEQRKRKQLEGLPLIPRAVHSIIHPDSDSQAQEQPPSFNVGMRIAIEYQHAAK